MCISDYETSSFLLDVQVSTLCSINIKHLSWIFEVEDFVLWVDEVCCSAVKVSAEQTLSSAKTPPPAVYSHVLQGRVSVNEPLS